MKLKQELGELMYVKELLLPEGIGLMRQTWAPDMKYKEKLNGEKKYAV